MYFYKAFFLGSDLIEKPQRNCILDIFTNHFFDTISLISTKKYELSKIHDRFRQDPILVNSGSGTGSGRISECNSGPVPVPAGIKNRVPVHP